MLLNSQPGNADLVPFSFFPSCTHGYCVEMNPIPFRAVHECRSLEEVGLADTVTWTCGFCQAQPTFFYQTNHISEKSSHEFLSREKGSNEETFRATLLMELHLRLSLVVRMPREFILLPILSISKGRLFYTLTFLGA